MTPRMQSEETAGSPVLLERVTDGVWQLTLNRPEIRNAFTDPQTLDALVGAFDVVESDGDAVVLIVTGVGTAFSAGGNLETMRIQIDAAHTNPEAVHRSYRDGIQAFVRRLYGTDLVTIAAVNGPAIGAGLDMAAMCDLRIASDAARFGETFVNVGLVSADGGSWVLPRVIGPQLTAQMTLAGRILDAHEALSAGLILEIVAAEDLISRAHALAASIAAKPRLAVRLNKVLIRQARDSSFSELLELAAGLQVICHQSDEHRKAIDDFFARR